MTWALGAEEGGRFCAGSFKAEKIAQGDEILWHRYAAQMVSISAVSNTQIDVAWQDLTGGKVVFEIERTETGGPVTIFKDGLGTSTQLSDNNLKHDTEYTYRVRGNYPGGQSGDFSIGVLGTKTLNLVAAPTAGSAAPISNTEIDLAWSDSSNNEDGYKVYRSVSQAGPFSEIADLPANTSSYSDAGLNFDTTYFYEIKGYNSDDISQATSTSATTSNALSDPSSFTASPSTFDSIDLSWTDTADNEDGYIVARSTDNITFTDIKTTLANESSFTDTALSPETTYYYQLRAFNTDEISNIVNASAATLAGMFAPEILSITSGTIGITIEIRDMTTIESSFTLERSYTSATTGFTAIVELAANPSGSPFTYTNLSTNDGTGPGELTAAGLVGGTTYYYRVKANNAQYGSSPYSAASSVTFATVNTTASSIFIGQNELGFSFTCSGDTTASPSSFIYEVSENSNFSVIHSVQSSPTFLSTYTFKNLNTQTNYYARLRVTGVIQSDAATVQASTGVLTDACVGTTVVISDDGDSTQTVTVTGARSNSLISVIEDQSGTGVRGVFKPVAIDEDTELWIGVCQSSANGGGKFIVDSGWGKFISYLPTSLTNYGDSEWWSGSVPNIGGPPSWLQSHKTYLDNGGSIYDISNIPSQFAFFHNTLKYVSRQVAPTNKVLYINDYDNALSSGFDFPYYGSHKFYHTFKDISEWAGYTFDQLPVNTGPGDTWLHTNAIKTLHTTAEAWKNYFNGYDAIIYAGVNGGNDETGLHEALPQAFIDGWLDFIDEGGGALITTDHGPIFTQSTNQLISNYGVLAAGSTDRDGTKDIYKISSILANQTYIPQGWHPLFSGLDVNSSIHAGVSECSLFYNTGQKANFPITSITSNYQAGTNGGLVISAHNDGNTLGDGALFVSTADGCGALAIPPGATTTWAETGLTEVQKVDVSNSAAVASLPGNVGDTDEDTWEGGMITAVAVDDAGNSKVAATGPYENFKVNEWYHVASSQSNGNFIFWVNGVAVAVHKSWPTGTNYADGYTNYNSDRFGNPYWNVGALQHAGLNIDGCFNGIIDQPALFSSALFQSDIDELYNGGNGTTEANFGSGLGNKVKYLAEFKGSFTGSDWATETNNGGTWANEQGGTTQKCFYSQTYGAVKNKTNISSTHLENYNSDQFILRGAGYNANFRSFQKVIDPGAGKVSSSGFRPFNSQLNLHNPTATQYSHTQVFDDLGGPSRYGGSNMIPGYTANHSTSFRNALSFPYDAVLLHETSNWGFSAWFKREGEPAGRGTYEALASATDPAAGMYSVVASRYPYSMTFNAMGDPTTTLYQNYNANHK